MRRLQILYILLLGLCFGCSNNKAKLAHTDNTTDSTLVFKYAENIKMEHTPEGIKVTLSNPWKKGETLHTYYLVDNAEKADNLRRYSYTSAYTSRGILYHSTC